ncbi:hypothetical protein OZZ08_10200 [Malaciobacter mytili]|uniref:hypothetical protein n=1 Tax=Malaciobacter mytili TaxID=603050 RepID=UPI003BB03E62
MSTSCILVRAVGEAGTNQAKLEGVRVNYSGYPEYMLGCLNDNWYKQELHDSLFSAGEISELHSNWEDTVLYNNSQKFITDCLAEMKRQAGVDYIYYYDSALGCWI